MNLLRANLVVPKSLSHWYPVGNRTHISNPDSCCANSFLKPAYCPCIRVTMFPCLHCIECQFALMKWPIAKRIWEPCQFVAMHSGLLFSYVLLKCLLHSLVVAFGLD